MKSVKWAESSLPGPLVALLRAEEEKVALWVGVSAGAVLALPSGRHRPQRQTVRPLHSVHVGGRAWCSPTHHRGLTKARGKAEFFTHLPLLHREPHSAPPQAQPLPCLPQLIPASGMHPSTTLSRAPTPSSQKYMTETEAGPREL